MANEYAQPNPEKLRHPVAEVHGLDNRTGASALTGAVTLTDRDGRMHVFDPGGANRNVVMFAPRGEDIGLVHTFYNAADAAEDLVVYQSDGVTSIATVGQNGSISIAWNGSTWSKTQVGGSSLTASVDTISEVTPGAGVTVDGLLIKDGDVRVSDSNELGIGTGAGGASDIVWSWDGTRANVTQLTANSEIRWGVDGAGIDQMWYGDTASTYMTWDQSADTLILADNAKFAVGTGSDLVWSWDGTRANVTQAAANSEIRWGVDGAGIDQVWYGDTASASMTWDQSADSLILAGVAKIKCQTIAAATGTAIPVTHSGSFPITQNGAETNTLADPTFLGQWLSIFVDTDTSGERVITAASRINQALNTTITLTEVGDFIKLEAITIGGALKWQVVANDGAALS